MGRTTKQSFWQSRSRSASAPATPRAGTAEPPLGCMSMVHYLIFAPGAGCVGRPPPTYCSSSSNRNVVAGIVEPRGGKYKDDEQAVKEKEKMRGGFEAPRNSLDLDADNLSDIQIGVQIEPVFDALACRKMVRGRATAPSSEAETPRTPSLVARLMGIDGLPEEKQQSPSPAAQRKTTKVINASRASSSSGAHKKEKEKEKLNSPSPASSKSKKKHVIPESMNREPLRGLSCNVGTSSSVPDTPMRESARASWDGALQELKRNVLDRAWRSAASLPTSPTNKSSKKKSGSRKTAKEIVRQAKETVASRKAAAMEEQRRRSSTSTDNKENVNPVVVRKDKQLLALGHQAQAAGKPKSVPSPSPPRCKEKDKDKEKPVAPTTRVALAPKHPPAPPPPPRVKPSRPPPPPPPISDTVPPIVRASKKPDGCERFATRIKQKPCSGAPPPPATTPPTTTAPASSTSPSSQQLPSSRAQRRRVLVPLPLEEDPEYGYLRKVLERGGFMRTTGGLNLKFRGPMLDPIVFHLLELELGAEDEDETCLGRLRHRWNRKLMFHLAQEILADLLLDLSSSSSTPSEAALGIGTRREAQELPRGAPLLARVWNRVRSLPAADCRVVGDIDALCAADLKCARVRRLARHPAVAEEAGDVAEELAEQVLQSLIQECV